VPVIIEPRSTCAAMIVTPDNAMNTFFASGLDTLVLGSFVAEGGGATMRLEEVACQARAGIGRATASCSPERCEVAVVDLWGGGEQIVEASPSGGDSIFIRPTSATPRTSSG
jgi:hypothetical protein